MMPKKTQKDGSVIMESSEIEWNEGDDLLSERQNI